MTTYKYFIGIFATAMSLVSCSDGISLDEPKTADTKPEMQFSFIHPDDRLQSRATETAFETGDKVGLFVNETSRALEIGGNTVNNEMLTCNGKDWFSTEKLYWDAGTYNATAYYPYQDEISSITDLPFSVRTDQTTPASDDNLSGYEASDFLYASAKNLTATSSPVNLSFRHVMSKLTVRMIKGDNYEGELPENATVYVHNTVPSATIDIEAGIVTKITRGAQQTITACKTGLTDYSAIIVPQRIENRVPLIEIVMEGVSFLFESKFQFKPGVHHIVNLVIEDNPDKIKIEIGGEITDWN